MPEILRDSIEQDEEILSDPYAQPTEKLAARIDLAICRRMIAKGIEVLEDGPGEGESIPEEA